MSGDRARSAGPVVPFVPGLATLGVALAIPPGAASRPTWFWAALVALAWAVPVPTPRGGVMTLGPGVLLAASPMLSDPASLGAVWGVAAAGWWLVSRIDSRTAGTVYDVAAGIWLVAAYVAVDAAFRAEGIANAWTTVVCLVAGGTAWFVARNGFLALAGRGEVETSARFAWLAGLEDWRSVVPVLAPGALFGILYPELAWWSLAVVGMLYGFGHLTALRHRRITRTYEQTIAALSRVPEVAALIPDGHAERTAVLATAIARRSGMSPPLVRRIGHAALLHDVGVIAAQAVGDVRFGQGRLAGWGAEIVGAVPTLGPVSRIIADHGLPFRTADGELARLVPGAAIVRATSAYEQRVALGAQPLEALRDLFRGAAYDYDPDVVNELRLLLVDQQVLSG